MSEPFRAILSNKRLVRSPEGPASYQVTATCPVCRHDWTLSFAGWDMWVCPGCGVELWRPIVVRSGRPRKAPGTHRNVHWPGYCTRALRDKLEAAAEAEGVSVQDYLFRLVEKAVC